MAVYAAHLTRTFQGTPSIFQVTAQEALGSTVKPALKKLVEYLGVVYPRSCGWCTEWYDELYLLLDCCLQYHYLKHYAASFLDSFYGLVCVPGSGGEEFDADPPCLLLEPASFSESFYGLVRVPVSGGEEFDAGIPRLPRLLERGSLLLLVLLPYVRDKLERLVDKWREDHEDGKLGKSTPDSLRKAAIKIYAIVHFVVECAKLAQIASYLVGGARAHSLSLALLGLSLRPAPPRDGQEYTWTDLAKSVFTGRIGNAALSFPMVGGLLLRAVEWGAFGVQFLRWWGARARASQPHLPVPAPPQKEERDERLTNKCPICLRTWRVPTVLPVSGYVFCYACISRHVRARRRCPLTLLPAAEAQLVRLYVD